MQRANQKSIQRLLGKSGWSRCHLFFDSGFNYKYPFMLFGDRTSKISLASIGGSYNSPPQYCVDGIYLNGVYFVVEIDESGLFVFNNQSVFNDNNDVVQSQLFRFVKHYLGNQKILNNLGIKPELFNLEFHQFSNLMYFVKNTKQSIDAVITLDKSIKERAIVIDILLEHFDGIYSKDDIVENFKDIIIDEYLTSRHKYIELREKLAREVYHKCDVYYNFYSLWYDEGIRRYDERIND